MRELHEIVEVDESEIVEDRAGGYRSALRLAAITLLAAVTAITQGCLSDDPGVALEDSAKPEFVRLCGTIGITLGAHDLQRYVIRRGEVARVDSLPAAPKGANRDDPFGALDQIHLDRVGQARARGAYLVSPDRRELVDFLLSMLHSYGHDLYGLEVYARSGQRVARSSLTQADIGGSGNIVWFDGCSAPASTSRMGPEAPARV